tara:strand:+ start:8420 stop:8578 length:159 start_codon:yes stop_codon:yes gene_type:complete
MRGGYGHRRGGGGLDAGVLLIFLAILVGWPLALGFFAFNSIAEWWVRTSPEE